MQFLSLRAPKSNVAHHSDVRLFRSEKRFSHFDQSSEFQVPCFLGAQLSPVVLLGSAETLRTLPMLHFKISVVGLLYCFIVPFLLFCPSS